VFWDVGANVGPFSRIAGDVLEEGRVVAFEPYPPNVERLRHILQRNDVPHEIESRALSDGEGERTFFVIGTDEAGSREGSIEDGYATTDDAVRTITVETTTADNAVTAGVHPPPNVVKIDVEGAAPAVLAGMEGTLARPDCRLLVVEPHDNEATIETVLEDAGFRTRRLRVGGSNRVVAERAE
jgi:FkbM family methyltransferase